MIDEHGFTKPTYDELLQTVIDKMQEVFGADIDVTATGRFGILARMMAWLAYQNHNLAEDVYNAAFVSKATGVNLDRLGSNYGLTRLPASIAYVNLTLTGTPGTMIPAVSQFKTAAGQAFMTTVDVTLNDDGNGTVACYSVAQGKAYNVAAHTITAAVQPNANITAITNEQAAAGGANLETDVDYRYRLLNAAKGVNNATANGLISSVQAVNGVRAVKVIANNGDVIDNQGNPPHTVHFYVLGGQAQAIATAIFNNLAFGVETVGGERRTVLDASQHNQTIAFDYATEKPLFAALTVTVNEAFPPDGVAQIQNQVAAYLAQLTMGDAVVYTRLYKFIYDNVPGVVDATIKLGTSADQLAAQNVAVATNEIATFNATNVTVTEVPA
ncbi:baseplate J/gp47 family protein [Furfurilactobacillus sp. WILCCON 0119]